MMLNIPIQTNSSNIS